MRDQDEVMEVYTSICERLRMNDFQALRRFRENSDLLPWLSVVAANACRDRLRKQRRISVPRSVLSKLNAFEELVFGYYYWQRIPLEDITEIIQSNHGEPCSSLDVIDAVSKINNLLSINKRWLLVAALNANRPLLSIDELAQNGYQPVESPDFGDEPFLKQDKVSGFTDAIKQLEKEDQLLLLLRFEHGMTAPQIAQVMRYDNQKYVYTRLRTVINKLRRTIVQE